MTRPRTQRRPVTQRLAGLGVAAVLAAAAALSGCTTAREAEAKANAGATATCPVTGNPEVKGAVRIGYQAIPNANLIVRDRRWLEACLPNATITWIGFDSGADVVQGFGSGSVDLATLGSSPATKALSAPLNVDMRVVWIDDVIGKAESLVVKDTSITTIAGLKGKTITTPFSSTSHYSLLQALADAGLNPGTDVKLVNLSPDKMLGAWQGDQVDAAWVWDPVLSELAQHGKIITGSDVTAEKGHPTFDLEGATGAFVTANPGFMETWTAVQNHAVQELAANPRAAAQSIAVQLGSTPEAVTGQLSGYLFPDARKQLELTAALPKQLSATAEFLKSQGDVDAVSPLKTYADGVYTDAIKKVA